VIIEKINKICAFYRLNFLKLVITLGVGDVAVEFSLMLG